MSCPLYVSLDVAEFAAAVSALPPAERGPWVTSLALAFLTGNTATNAYAATLLARVGIVPKWPNE